MATLTTQTFDESGATLSFDSAGGSGDKWANNGNQQILIKNDSGAEVTLTVTTQVTTFESPEYGYSTKPNVTLIVPGSRSAIAGPFPVSAYNDVDGNCNISYSATTSVEVAIFEINI
jgi:hypothetical protein